MSFAASNDFAKHFGKFVRDGRLAKNFSQKDLALYMDMGQPYLSRIEQGLRNVDLELAFKLCEYLELDLNEFIKSTRKS